MTPLHMAVEGARIKVVEYLVGQEADVNFQDHTGVKCTTCDSSDYTFNFSLILRQVPCPLFLYSAV